MVNLFALHLNKKLPIFVSPVPDSMTCKEDTFQYPWHHFDVYMCFSFVCHDLSSSQPSVDVLRS